MMRGKYRMTSWLVPLIVMAFLVASCGLAVAEETLAAAGATFPYPLYSKWFDVYKKTADVSISYQAIGSGGGIRQLKSGLVDIGASDAPLTAQEAKDMPGEVLTLPTVAGAVAIVYNLPGADKRLKLTPDVIADLFLGKIKKWNDKRIASPNPGMDLPSLPVAVVHRSDGSGTSFIFTSYLSAVSRAWAVRVGAGKSVDWPAGIGGKGNEGVAGMVSQTPGGVGYVELSYATQNRIPYASVRNRTGKFVEPTLASTTAAAAGFEKAMQKNLTVLIVNAPGDSAYPIAGFTYLMVYRNQQSAARGRAVAEFLWWAIHDGQKHAPGLRYSPLPDEVTKLVEGKVKQISNAGKPLLAK
jgi:phosphate transport system substrate-binding protein